MFSPVSLRALAAALAALALVSCGGTDRTPPPTGSVPSALSGESRPVTGQVEFRGFTPEALADFRVIPEEGTELFVPTNRIHPHVDGFWWRASRRWFKIPNHCSVVLTAAPEPARPSAFTETHDCSEFGTALQKLRGLPDTAGFYDDEGASGHGTDYPFVP